MTIRSVSQFFACALTVLLLAACAQPTTAVTQTEPEEAFQPAQSKALDAQRTEHDRVPQPLGGNRWGTPQTPAVTLTATALDPRRELQPDDLKSLSWRSVGPANMAGRVADICLAPGNPKLFFVAFATGGLFKTANAGTTFTPVFDKEATSSIGSVVVCDAPPDWPGWAEEPGDDESPETEAKPGEKRKAKIVWVGTGEGNGRNSSSWGNGVYRSTDGGSTFKHLGLADSHDIPRLAVDPRNPDVCYVAALGHLWGPNEERGIYKTIDGGETWQPALQIDENTGACDVLIDPQAPDTVYAAMYMRRRSAYSFQSGGPEGGIYRSDDAGATWKKLTNGLPPQAGRIGLDIYLQNPDILYAVIESDVGGWGVSEFDNRSKAGGVFRTVDRGETWTRVNDLTPRAFYFGKIRVDPTNDQRVYLPGWGLGISEDGGKTFRAGGARVPHVDHHAMVIDPDDPEHLFIGTDGGVYISHDGAKSWDFINHLAVGQFYNVEIDLSDPYRIGGGMQDNGTWIGPSATMRNQSGDFMGRAGGITNADWFFVHGGDGFHVAFDPIDPDIVYAEMQGGGLIRIHLDTGIRTRIQPSPKEGEARFRWNWNTPFFISPHEPTTLYVAGNYVFKLTERGDRWEKISDDLSTRAVEKLETAGSVAEQHCTITALAESPIVKGMIWAGTDDGLVHVTANDGETWTDVTPPQANGLYISRIEPSHHDRNTAYISIDGHRSDDTNPRLLMTAAAGKMWTSIVGDLPDGAPIKVVREDLLNPNVLYIGTERAAHLTIDRGEHWVKLNGESLPPVPVDDLKQHPREMDLVAGTHGRSIYVMDDASPLSQLTPEIVQKPLHVFEPLPAKPVVHMPIGGLWGDQIFLADNPPMGAIVHYWIREYTGDEVSVTITDGNDIHIRKLTGTNRPGINRVVWDLEREKYDRYPNPDEGLGNKDFVPPGEYNVTISCGKESAKTKVTVSPKPGGQ